MNGANTDSELAILVCYFVNNCFNSQRQYPEPSDDKTTESNEPACIGQGGLCQVPLVVSV